MPIKIVLATFIAAAVLMPASVSAATVTCRLVGGYFNGAKVSAVRRATMRGDVMTLTGTFNSKKSPARKLYCVRLHAGVMCSRKFGPVGITVMTRKRQMVETVTDPNGNELANISYECNGALRF